MPNIQTARPFNTIALDAMRQDVEHGLNPDPVWTHYMMARMFATLDAKQLEVDFWRNQYETLRLKLKQKAS